MNCDSSDDTLTVSYQNPSVPSDYWTLRFRAPFDNTYLVPGTYLNAERAPFRTLGRPGLEVSGRGRGSNTLTGQFTILDLQANSNGTIARFAADFEQHSEGATPALRGSIRYNYVPGSNSGGLLTNMLLRETGLELDRARIEHLQRVHTEAYRRHADAVRPLPGAPGGGWRAGRSRPRRRDARALPRRSAPADRRPGFGNSPDGFPKTPGIRGGYRRSRRTPPGAKALRA